jgi:hypothetical protein
MCQDEYKAAMAAFIRIKGITRCPTACALPTQGVVAAADQVALQNYAMARERVRRKRIAAHVQTSCSAPVMADLPPPNTKRWTIRRKSAVVVAVKSGEITLEEACRHYLLSEEEFRNWQRGYEVHGLPALCATRLQQYRTPPSSPPARPHRLPTGVSDCSRGAAHGSGVKGDTSPKT